MKNWLGAIGGPRNQLHQDLDKAMVDLAAFFKPTAHRARRLPHPDAERPAGRPHLGRQAPKDVVASVDPVAADAVGAGFFDIPPEELAYISLAAAARPGPDRPGEAPR